MGILNVTPDSFSDGGHYTQVAPAVEQAKKMHADGADIIDVGGESSRPGADAVSVDQQISRVVPVIAAIRATVSATLPLSIDTTSSEVAEAAFSAGANIINDISAAKNDQQMLAFASAKQAPIVLMHMQGKPKTMQDNPHYEQVVEEVILALSNSSKAAQQAGIKKSNIVLDPGIGFGKRKADNLNLLAHLDALVQLGFPVLLGTSRKRFMGDICAVSEPAELVVATAATTALGVMAGVKLFRVHDVKANRQAADVAWAIKQRIPTGRLG